MTVIPFQPRRLPSRPLRPVEPPAALTLPAHREESEGPEFYSLRARQNWAVLALVILLLAAGAWLIDRLQTFSRAMACYEFGHRNCVPLEIELPPR
jgi:hypothetical protein